MVSMSKKRVKSQGPRRGGLRTVGAWWPRVALILLGIGAGLVVLWLVVVEVGWIFRGPGASLGPRSMSQALWKRLKRQHPHIRLAAKDQALSEYYNVAALDILQTLACEALLNRTEAAGGWGDDPRVQPDDIKQIQEVLQPSPPLPKEGGAAQQRKLIENPPDAPEQDDAANGWKETDFDEAWMPPPTARHLFCVAALSSSSSSSSSSTDRNKKNQAAASTVEEEEEDDDLLKAWTQRIQCAASQGAQQDLLDLWMAARSEFPEVRLLETVLDLAVERQQMLVGQALHLWSYPEDGTLEYELAELNKKENDLNGVYGLDKTLSRESYGPHADPPLFVDVGSGQGYTLMAVAILYPGIHLVGIEAAAPNWLLQEINWRCNQPRLPAPASHHVRLAGVGPQPQGTSTAKFLWRPTAAASTRSWTPSVQRQANVDWEILVQLKPWPVLLAEAGVADRRVAVLQVDCEGCEYNVIPAMSEAEFERIATVMGGMHWAYIPLSRKPSSARARVTHQRLCRHEALARISMECCAFPQQEVKSRNQGEILVKEDGHKFPPQPATVADLMGNLCRNFTGWQKQHHLNDIESDWGWFQLSSTAD